MKIRINVLEGDCTTETNTVSEKKKPTGKTKPALIGDQESILRGLSLLNDSTVVLELINSSSHHAKPSHQTLENRVIHSWTVASDGALKINEVYN